MKKILFFTSEPLDDPKRGTPLRIYNFIKQIAKAHDVLVLAPSVDKRLVVKTPVYPTGGQLAQIKTLTQIVRSEKIDVLMTATEINLLVPVVVKWLTGVKIAIDLHGLYAEEMYFQGMMGYWKSRLVKLFVEILLPFYDLIFVVSPKLGGYYRRVSQRTVPIYGGVNEEEFHSRQEVAPRIFTIGYTGNAKSYQGIDYILEAAFHLRRQNLFPFRLNLIMSSGRGEIESKLEALGLADITDTCYKVSHEEVNDLIGRSSVLAIPRPSLPLTEYAYPSKLPEYLATEVPVILTEVGPVGPLLGSQNCAKIIPAEKITENLTKAFVEIEALGEIGRAELGRRAAQFVRNNLTWDKLGSSINNHLERL